MGVLRPCLSTSGDSVEYAVLELYDEASARSTSPGFDDVLGEPFLVDSDADGIGDRVRPGTEVEVKCKARAARHDEQVQDGTGNAPEGSWVLTFYASDLAARGLLVGGACLIRPNDRLKRLRANTLAATVRVDFEAGGAAGLFCYEVRPGETGEGTYTALFERRRAAAL